MKEITWDQMIRLRKKDFAPFTLVFYLSRPVDSEWNIAFTNTIVKGFKGSKALVECDGEEWFAVSAEKIYVEAV